MTDLHGWITQQVDTAEQRADRWHDIECKIRATTRDTDDAAVMFVVACGCNGPATTRRRYAGDRKILAEHSTIGDGSIYCVGCNVDYEEGAFTPNINDCPTLHALAEGYGLTAEILAGLDRPQPPTVKRRGPMPDTSRVPAALRGPNWGGRP
ncbi:hypothetical protein ACFWPQ_01585 [Streptomyces sp. NPDC058464]|uniref:hypothetical protein n=1 Tax=Streptomyces sp. NPDC058464 TaxID=3346511 RepID=UPI00365EE845